jgi:hypothetical protein
MTTTFADHKHSVTYHTNDLSIVFCLRALSKYAQKLGNQQIAWGGTKKKDWLASGKRVTLRFSCAAYRTGFNHDVARLLPPLLVQKVAESDSDPAQPHG